MAEDKKPEAKPEVNTGLVSSMFSHPDPFVEIVWGALTIVVLMTMLNGILSMIHSSSLFSGQNGLDWWKLLQFILSTIFYYLKYILIVLSVILIVDIIYLRRRVVYLRKNEAQALYVESTEAKQEENLQWGRILNHIESVNDNDWRLAILEADIMLNTVLDNLALPGETIGDKLKAVEKSDFLTVDNAWEAHKIRNQIAHEGSSFALTQREAKRVIELYKTVFEEFHMI